MAVGGLGGQGHPGWQGVDPERIRQQDEYRPTALLEQPQQRAGAHDVRGQTCLGSDAHEAQLGDRRGREPIGSSPIRNPPLDARVEGVCLVRQSEQGIDVEEIGQGKSTSSARICSGVTRGVRAGANITGNPVTELFLMM